jgi:hypothetical protein
MLQTKKVNEKGRGRDEAAEIDLESEFGFRCCGPGSINKLLKGLFLYSIWPQTAEVRWFRHLDSGFNTGTLAGCLARTVR